MYLMDNYYTIPEILELAGSLLLTKIFYPGATLIRRPFVLRGAPRFKFGKGFTTGHGCRIETFGGKDDLRSKLVVGKNLHIGDYVHIAAAESVTIGDNCLFASKIFISDLDHGSYDNGPESCSPLMPPGDRPLSTAPVVIGDNVWLGDNVCVLKGVRIGSGCIVGSNSVVTRDIPDFSIAVGSPARVIKRYDEADGRWTAVRAVENGGRKE